MLTLYRNIKKFRTERGMSQETLARLTGYTDRSSIAKIENGDVDLQQSKINKFAKALGVSPGDLMGNVDDTVELKEVGYIDAEDAAILRAYHSASDDIKDAVRRVLGL